MKGRVVPLDGNEAIARVAYQISDVIAIYPITPASSMGEWADEWAAKGIKNLWDTVPSVIEMQSEGGVAGAMHGALQTGALATSFTSSQGLLLMIPNMFKIAGELLPCVVHVAARAVATHAITMFGDHSDVMSTRSTGWAMLSSGSVQEAQDLALIAHRSTLESRIPFLHYIDGFRTSHEVNTIVPLEDGCVRAMIDDATVLAHRSRGLSPDHPVVRGTAQNPDVFFQGREATNAFHAHCPDVVQESMDQFGALTGRHYNLFDYSGAPDAERVIVLMGSGAEAAQETVDYLAARGEKVGMVRVHLYRPFDFRRFMDVLPATTRAVGVLDRTKEPGATGEPLYLDCLAALCEGLGNGWGTLRTMPVVVGGRYGLASKEFNPAMVKAAFENLAQPRPKNHFTIGIDDDVTHTSLVYDPDFSVEPDSVVRALFFGLGSDGTVSANKSSIKIIGEETDRYAQAYFVYDSKKSGTQTVSHVRIGKEPIRSTYLIDRANFVACHQPVFLERYDMLRQIMPCGTFLLNTTHGPDTVWQYLPRVVQEAIVQKNLQFYIVDAAAVARKAGPYGRINVVMQTCFFALSNMMPREQATEAIKRSIAKAYRRQGAEIIKMDLAAVDSTLANLHRVHVPSSVDSIVELKEAVPACAPRFVREVLGVMIAGRGDELSVGQLPVDGTFPTGTAKWEKRSLAHEIPVWEPDICIQCGKCAMVCPHAVIRIKAYAAALLEGAPTTFKATESRDRAFQGQKYSIQVAPEDCTGCGICVDVCPAKSKSETRLKALHMQPQTSLREHERDNWEFFVALPEVDRRLINVSSIRQQQLQQPLLEFSGACAGCGETPYVKLLTQLFGDRLIIANASGCSSVFGGNLPTAAWTTNAEGRGPAWANSLFEDNAEFGLGFRVSIDKQRQFAQELLRRLASTVGERLADDILGAEQRDEAEIAAQRERVAALKACLLGSVDAEARHLLQLADMLVRRSVWIVGGDGWAYDIGYGGLDHVLASGENVKMLVLDTEVYSNTGGQRSKATPRGAIAKFAAGGKQGRKKDLGLMAMTYGNIYVAGVAMGGKDEHTLKSFIEAEAYDGPALIIAYAHCISHGIPDMSTGMQQQKAAVESGQWLLYRYNPDLARTGGNPLILDSRTPKIPLEQYMYAENRFKMLVHVDPERARAYLDEAQHDVHTRLALYQYLAGRPIAHANGHHSVADREPLGLPLTPVPNQGTL
jgi:pyruvate-ferredoxin/flavodoxin oxidoreductase